MKLKMFHSVTIASFFTAASFGCTQEAQPRKFDATITPKAVMVFDFTGDKIVSKYTLRPDDPLAKELRDAFKNGKVVDLTGNPGVSDLGLPEPVKPVEPEIPPKPVEPRKPKNYDANEKAKAAYEKEKAAYDKALKRFHDRTKSHQSDMVDYKQLLDEYNEKLTIFKYSTLKKLMDALKENVEVRCNRIVTAVGDAIEIYAIHSIDAQVQVDAKEDSRDTLFAQEASLLWKGLKVLPIDPGGPRNIFLIRQQEFVKLERADLLVTGSKTWVDEKGEQKKDSQGIGFVTGPKEHLSLAAELPIQKVAFKDGSAQPTERPKELHVGLFYRPFGDVLTTREDWRPGQKVDSLLSLLVIKASCTFSSKPLESSAIGVGIKMPYFGGDLKFLSGLCFTRSVMWVEGDRPVAGGGTQKYHQRTWVWMVGYDLMQVKGWFK